jgi:hypothetical protein
MRGLTEFSWNLCKLIQQLRFPDLLVLPHIHPYNKIPSRGSLSESLFLASEESNTNLIAYYFGLGANDSSRDQKYNLLIIKALNLKLLASKNPGSEEHYRQVTCSSTNKLQNGERKRN